MLIEEANEPRHLKILDFGLAKLVDRDDQITLSATGAALGSPAYMSPEQATGMKSDRRCDLYSLGCIIYEMLIGSPPLLGNSPTETLIRRLNEEIPPLSDKSIRTFPASVEELVRTLLQRDPQDRYQSAEEVRDMVEHLLRACKDEYSSISFSINPSDDGTGSGTYGAIAAISGADGGANSAPGGTGGGIYGASGVAAGAQTSPNQLTGSTSGGGGDISAGKRAAITPDTSAQEQEPRSQPPRRNHPRNTVKDMAPTNPLTDPRSVRDRRVGERPSRTSRTDLRSPGVPSVRADARDASCRVRARNSDPSLAAIQSPKTGRGSGSKPAVRKPYHLRPDRQSALGQDLLRRISEQPPAIIVTLIMIVIVTLWLLVSLIAR
jgi:Serine/threonine protein kinase